MVIYMVCYFMDYCIMTDLILQILVFFYFIFIRDYIINLIMNKYYYFIIIIVIIIICIILKKNINEKFQEAECQSDIIVTELCEKICNFTSPDPNCVDKCRPFAKASFIDQPDNIWGYFLLKHIRSHELLQKRSMLENARDFLVVQTELAAKLTQLYDSSSENELLLGNIWKIYDYEDLVSSKDIDEISDLTSPQINIINKLKETLKTADADTVNFDTQTVPTLLEIKSIIPRVLDSAQLTLPDRYSYWISIAKGDGNKLYYKPYNFRCSDRINELLTHNNFIKLNNKILGQLWELYISIPEGEEITYLPLTLFEEKINNIDGKKWLEFLPIDRSMYVKLNDDSPFTIWLKLLLSIKNPITSNEKTYYDFTHNEFNIIKSFKADYSQLTIYHYVVINEGDEDEKCYRPFDDIYFASNFDGLTQISSHNSYISHTYNGENIYFKIIPPMILNSAINQMCSDNNYVLDEEYSNYDKSTIKSKISNKITLTQITDESKNNNLNSKDEILNYLNTRSTTSIQNNDLQYYELNDVVNWFNQMQKDHQDHITEKKTRRENIKSNCQYTLDDVKAWNSRNKIIIGTTEYGNVKPVSHSDKQFYIANSDTNREIDNIGCLLNNEVLSLEPANFSLETSEGRVNYGKIKKDGGDGKYVEIGGVDARNYIDSQCYITTTDINKYGKIKKDGGDGKYVLVGNTYGEIGIDDGKYGKITDNAGNYGLINTSVGATNDDYIPISQCNEEYKTKRQKDIIDRNVDIGTVITTMNALYKELFEDAYNYNKWDKIKKDYCINEKLVSLYNTCISDHLQDDKPVLSYSEFKGTNDYTSVENTKQINGEYDAQTDWDGNYIDGQGEGTRCKPMEGKTNDMYIRGGECEEQGLKCIDREKIISIDFLNNKRGEIKANKEGEVRNLGFKENIANYANKYINTDTLCSPADYVPNNWVPGPDPCTDENKKCDFTSCPDSICPANERCVLKTHTATEAQIQNETGNTPGNTYNTYYDIAKNNWGGKYSSDKDGNEYSSHSDAKECVTRESVPSNYKAQDSDEVCGENLECADVVNHVRDINEASNVANAAACILLGRNSCADMKEKLDECVTSSCHPGKMIDITTCSKENASGKCINCPPCEEGKRREGADGNWKDSVDSVDSADNYCGSCVPCKDCTDPNKWASGCTGVFPFPDAECMDCGECLESDLLTYKDGCDKNGNPICESMVEHPASGNYWRKVGVRGHPQGVLLSAVTCADNKYLSGFEKATQYNNGKPGQCMPCEQCDLAIEYNKGCPGSDNPGECIKMICGSCPADSGKYKVGCANTFSTGDDGIRTYDANCVDCPLGTKQTIVNSANECTPCGVGEYQDVAGETTCKSCTTVCEFGIQTDNCSGTGSRINNVCYAPVTCPAGQYLQVSTSVGVPPFCSDCPANTYQPNNDNTQGIDSCISCGDGTTVTILSSDTGSSCCEYKRCNAADEYVQATYTGGICSRFSSADCGICSSGERKIGCKLFPNLPSSTQSDIVVNCEACPSNFVSSGTDDACIECSEGEVAVEGVCVLHTCGQGQFVGTSSGQANCQQCPANTYRQESTHSFTTCSPCPNKENSPGGAASCANIAPCPKNHYINVREPGTLDDVTCELCRNDENTAVDNQLTSCNKIFCGTNQKLNKRPSGNDGSTDVSCTSCPADKYINQENHQRTECWRECICEDGTPIISQDCEDFYNKNLGTGGEYWRGGQGGNRQLTACDSCSSGVGESYQTCFDNDLTPVNMNRQSIMWGASSSEFRDPWGARTATCPCPAGGCSSGGSFMQGNFESEFNLCYGTPSQPRCSAINTYKKCS